MWAQALAQGLAGHLHRLAVQVAAARGGGRRRVRHLVGRGGHRANAPWGDAQLVGADGEHLGVQPLTHLGAAVVQLHGAVGVENDERAGLIQEARGETDAELHRRDGETALVPRRGAVEGIELDHARGVLRRLQQLVPDARHAVVLHLHVVRRAVAWSGTVEIPPTHVGRVELQRFGGAAQDRLDDGDALGASEAAKRRVRRQVRLRHAAAEVQRGHVVRVVRVEQRPVENRARQVGRKATVREGLELQRREVALFREACFVAGEKRVALAGLRHVLVAVEPDLHRPTELLRRERGHRCERSGLRFLAAEPATHAGHLDGDLVAPAFENVRDDRLHFAGVLGRAEQLQRSVFFGQRERGLRLEIEVVLPAGADLAAQPQRALEQLGVDIAAARGVRVAQPRARSDGGVERGERGQWLVLELDGLHALAARFIRLADDDADALPHELHEVGREQRLVVNDGADFVVTGDVFGEEHGDDPGHVARLRGTASRESGMRVRGRDDLPHERVHGGIPADRRRTSPRRSCA